MFKHLRRAAFSFLAFPLLGGGLASAQGTVAAPMPTIPLTAEQQTQVAAQQRLQGEAWRREYPYVSLVERLSYEHKHREAPAPKVGPAGERLLREIDGQYGLSGDNANPRARSLKMLHSDQVEKFVSSQGFGIRRMDMTPSPIYLPIQAIPTIEFAKLPPLSAEESAAAPTSYLNGDLTQLRKPETGAVKLLPTRDEIVYYHRSSILSFADIPTFGHVKSRDQVAGFTPHGFRDSPQLALIQPRALAPSPNYPDAVVAPDPRNWKIARLELVSLLKHAEPRVYESEHLPRMDELKAVPTRALTKFESESLAKLREGEEVPTLSTTNHIQMLGAIRAGNHCLQCHEVPHGTLLGAFSYDLRRDPPLKSNPDEAPVQ